MPKQGKRAKSEHVDEASAESFPASDPPSWTLGGSDGTASATPAALPGTLHSPAPRAAVGADGVSASVTDSAIDAHPTPAELVPHLPLDAWLAGAGVAAAALGFVLTIAGEARLGRALSRGGTTLLLVGVFRRLGALAPGAGAGAPLSYH